MIGTNAIDIGENCHPINMDSSMETNRIEWYYHGFSFRHRCIDFKILMGRTHKQEASVTSDKNHVVRISIFSIYSTNGTLRKELLKLHDRND